MPAGKKKNQQKKKKQKPQQPRAAAVRARAGFGAVSAPTALYIKQLLNPRSVVDHYVGVPTIPSFPSRKLRTFSRGTFVTGTSGTGFVGVQVFLSRYNDGTEKCVNFSETNYAYGYFAKTNSGNVGDASHNSPYATTDTTVSHRLVSFALYIRYIGTEANRGGQVVGFQAPYGVDLTGKTLSQIQAWDGVTSTRGPGSQELRLSWVPQNNTDMEYYSGGTAHPQEAKINMGFIVVAPDASVKQTYSFETVAIWELQSTDGSVRGATSNHADPIGLSAVKAEMSAAEGHHHVVPGGSQVRDLVNRTSSRIIHAASGAGHAILNMGVDAAATAATVLAANHMVHARAHRERLEL